MLLLQPPQKKKQGACTLLQIRQTGSDHHTAQTTQTSNLGWQICQGIMKGPKEKLATTAIEQLEEEIIAPVTSVQPCSSRGGSQLVACASHSIVKPATTDPW